MVKAIGDAGLFAYPAEAADAPVRAMAGLKLDLDAWLASRGYPGPVTMNAGAVAVGEVGAPGRGRIDVYGQVVNAAAMLRGRGLVITAALHAQHLPSGGGPACSCRRRFRVGRTVQLSPPPPRWAAERFGCRASATSSPSGTSSSRLRPTLPAR